MDEARRAELIAQYAHGYRALAAALADITGNVTDRGYRPRNMDTGGETP